MSTRPMVVVIGAGIVGASLAWHLARRGASVTVLDAGSRGGVATPASWAWINASWGNPEPYFRLRMQSMEDWRALGRQVPDLCVDWLGGLLWDLPEAELDRFAKEFPALGHDVRPVDRAEAARLEPRLVDPPRRAVHVASEGAVDARAAALALLAEAARMDATVRERTSVDHVVVRNGRVFGVATRSGPLAADAVVVAAGEGTPDLLAPLGVDVPLRTPPGLLVVSRPAPRLLNGLVMSPGLHVRQDAQGRLIGGADFGGTDPGAEPDAIAADTFTTMQALLQGGEALRFAHHTIGRRPVPTDDVSIAGAVPDIAGLHLAVTHSGVTLAPVLGRLLAELILDGRRDPLLAPFGIERFGAISPA